MIAIFNINDMTPEDIQMEIASILATGYLRYHRQFAAKNNQHREVVDSSEELGQLTKKQLDLSGPRSPNARTG